ncbi:MAG: hypothetical protein COV67_10110 [Nitrospinae bacterium CG11_big_fil_rev_8_21_14_0_20_56_8]|nr:MAG: hypothetical protein COV67_10110 [Nitrospinae bacterium CG11_big_fil_rev_8_21_14_0_20_56_8]
MNEVVTHPSIRTFTLKKSSPGPFEAILDTIRLNLELCTYRLHTIKAYLGQIQKFVDHARPKGPEELYPKDLAEYLEDLVEQGLSRSTIDQTVTAMHYLSRELFGEPLDLGAFRRPRKNRYEPVVLSEEEVKQISVAAGNPKHRLMIELAFSAGLRVSEVVDVRVAHINLEKGLLFIPGKGIASSRTTVFAPELKDALSRQIGNKQPDHYLFPSERGGQLTTRSVAKFFKSALKASGISKDATPHTLRNSFLTCMLNKGTDPLSLQALLGRRTL